jgi:hypothetical protein
MNFFLLFKMICLLVILISCKNDYTITPLPESSPVNEIAIKEIPSYCYLDAFIIDSLLILTTECDDYVFHVYHKESLELITKFGEKGRAPFEFDRPRPFNIRINSNIFDFYDVNLFQYKYINFKKILSGEPVPDCVTMNYFENELSDAHMLNYINSNAIAGRSFSEINGMIFIFDKELNKKIGLILTQKLEFRTNTRN